TGFDHNVIEDHNPNVSASSRHRAIRNLVGEGFRAEIIVGGRINNGLAVEDTDGSTMVWSVGGEPCIGDGQSLANVWQNGIVNQDSKGVAAAVLDDSEQIVVGKQTARLNHDGDGAGGQTACAIGNGVGKERFLLTKHVDSRLVEQPRGGAVNGNGARQPIGLLHRSNCQVGVRRRQNPIIGQHVQDG